MQGKFLGIAKAFTMVLGPAAIIGSAALWLSSANEASGLSYGRLFWMSAGYVIYLAGTLAVTLAVSAYARSSHFALIVLLGFWAANTFIAPRLATDISKSISPIPSSAEFGTAVERDIRNGIADHDPENQHLQELRQRVLKKYGVGRVEELPFNFGGMALQASEEYGNRVFDSHFASLWDSYERQAGIQQIGGIIAPVLAIRSLSMGMAGTDVAHYRRFAVAAEAYRRQMVKTLNDDLTQHAKPGVTYVAGREVWERIPDFAYQMPGARWAIANQTASLVVLAFWCALAGLAAIAATSRIAVVERG